MLVSLTHSTYYHPFLRSFFLDLKKWKLIHSVKNIFLLLCVHQTILMHGYRQKRLPFQKFGNFIAYPRIKFSAFRSRALGLKKLIMNTNPIFSLNHMYGKMSAYLVWAPIFNHSLATGSKFLVQEWAFMFLHPFILLSLQTECNCSMSFEEHVHDKSLKSSPLTQVCLCWNDKVNNILCFIFSSTWHIWKIVLFSTLRKLGYT